MNLFKKGWKIVIIHGGGKEISNWINKQGIEPQFVDGLRVTEEKTLEVAIAVLSGKINAEIVTEFQNMGIDAVGISGSSGIIEAKSKDEKLGFVGEITSCNINLLNNLMDNGFLPIISPLAIAIRCDLFLCDISTISVFLFFLLKCVKLIILKFLLYIFLYLYY